MREFIKFVARSLANLLAVPFLISFFVRSMILGRDRALEGSTQLLALWPGTTGQFVRRAFLAWTIKECHPSALISFGTFFSKSTARVRARVYIGPYCSIGSATIEEDVLIATGTHLLSGGRIHGFSDPNRPIREQPGVVTQITIGAGSWLGAGVIAMADVGRDSIIAAGGVVTQAVPDRMIAGGVPAKVIRSRDEAV